jgi:hypothetical protein
LHCWRITTKITKKLRLNLPTGKSPVLFVLR